MLEFYFKNFRAELETVFAHTCFIIWLCEDYYNFSIISCNHLPFAAIPLQNLRRIELVSDAQLGWWEYWQLWMSWWKSIWFHLSRWEHWLDVLVSLVFLNASDSLQNKMHQQCSKPNWRAQCWSLKSQRKLPGPCLSK